MVCPYCNKYMVRGFIRSGETNIFGDVLWWVEDTGKVLSRKERVRVHSGGKLRASYCSKCQKIMIDLKALNDQPSVPPLLYR